MNNNETQAQKLERISTEMREKYGSNTIVVFATNELTYEAYGTSAKEISKIYKLLLEHRDNIAYIDFNDLESDIIFAKMVREGFKIAILDRKDYN